MRVCYKRPQSLFARGFEWHGWSLGSFSQVTLLGVCMWFPKGIFIIAAVVVLLLKFSLPFTNGIGCFMELSLESSISFLMSIFRRNLTVPFFKYCCFFVVLVVPNFFARIWNSFTEADNSVLFNLHFVCTIITVVNLNNFKYHTKIRLCSQANQNHLLRDFVSFSAGWDKWDSSQASALLF